MQLLDPLDVVRLNKLNRLSGRVEELCELQGEVSGGLDVVERAELCGLEDLRERIGVVFEFDKNCEEFIQKIERNQDGSQRWRGDETGEEIVEKSQVAAIIRGGVAAMRDEQHVDAKFMKRIIFVRVKDLEEPMRDESRVELDAEGGDL
jgi:hypothetical protein